MVPTGFGALGFLFGYFLTYSIRHGSKTQDAFKSFLGVLGVGSGAAAASFIPEALRLPALLAYGWGTVIGLGVYVLLAVVLAGFFSACYTKDPQPGWGLWGETVAKVLLGEDFRPKA